MTNKTVPYRHDRGSGHGRGGYGAGRGGTGTGRGGHGPAHNNLNREHTHQRYVPVGAPQARRSDIELSQHSPQGATDHQQGLSSDVESGKAKKPHPPFCWKCKCTILTAEICRADLDCVICNKKNVYLSTKCPLLKMSKPTASLFGSAKTEMGFLSMPEFDFKLETPEPAPTALVKVTSGVLDVHSVQAELAKLTRADWRWEALPHGEDSYLVVFRGPSRVFWRPCAKY